MTVLSSEVRRGRVTKLVFKLQVNTLTQQGSSHVCYSHIDVVFQEQ